MDRPLAWLPTLAILALLAVASLAWAGHHALRKSDDLMRRAEEISLFVKAENPYHDPDMTYPPTALPVFAPLVAPFLARPVVLRAVWLALNLVVLVVLCATIVRLWGKSWPGWLQAAFCLAVVACKPVRGGIGLGQFHLVPVALMLLSLTALKARRPTLAGLLVGIALAKPTMVAPFLGFLAVRRQWRTLFTAGLLQGAMLLGVSGWLRISPDRLIADWLANARSQLNQGVIDIPSLLERAWPAAPASASQVALGVLILTFAMMYLCRRQNDLRLVSFCMFMSALFTYHRHYDLVLLVPALAAAIEAARTDTGPGARTKTLVATLLAIALISPSNSAITGRYEIYYNIFFIIIIYSCFIILYLPLFAEFHVSPREPSPPTAHPLAMTTERQ
ncbi:MAG TPA: glycosyltransferase family 87 protein [Isosphaeraceae bacterium]|jgi:hypothetical protein|nr:glycosyltransferase family 87 protein [Isosphaeraceae bacterium]